MSSMVVGAMLGAAFGGTLWWVVDAVVVTRRDLLAVRVLPYLRDLPSTTKLSRVSAAPATPRSLGASLLAATARLVEKVAGGASSVERRLVRANLPMTVHDFRVAQVVWGLVAFAVAAVPAGIVSVRTPPRTVPLLVCALAVGVLAVLLRENRLTAQVKERERQILAEFPAIASLLALAVAAGESPAGALERVVARAHGELAVDLRRVLAAVRTGVPITQAFDDLASRTGLPVVARFAEGLAIAVERGTPLADVLHAQAGDVREASRRSLIETGARKEVLMMVPVVFLVLPVVVVFAFFPGLVGLRLVV